MSPPTNGKTANGRSRDEHRNEHSDEHSKTMPSCGPIIFRTCGLSEDQVRDQLKDVLAQLAQDERVSFSLHSHSLGTDVQVELDVELQVEPTSLQNAEPDFLSRLKDEIRLRLGDGLYGEGEESMEDVVGGLLRQHGHTLATAESCTGGLIASRITDVAGSSEYFLQGVVVYSNQAKKDLLGVREETLADFGAVSEQTIREMCAGIRRLSRADLALAISALPALAEEAPKSR